MDYSHRYHAYPIEEVAERLEHHLDLHRQLYNHVKWDYENSPEDDKPSEYDQNNKLPEWKQQWPVFSELHSKAAQATVARFHHNLTVLSELKENGYNVGRLNRQAPADYRSVTYNQSGFDLDEKRGRDRFAYVRFSKIGWVKIRYHRPIPDHATIKEVTIKKETTGEWFVSFGLETDDDDLPEKSDVNSLDTSNSVGIDLGIQNYLHTSDGKTVDWLNLEDEYDRLRREQRKLSRKEHESNNYEKQRREVAKIKRHIRRKVLDYQHKLTTWLVREYDAVFVEDLDVAGMLQGDGNARNKQDAAWRQFITLLEYKADLYGCHVVQVEARGTTKECARCGVETAKPIWVREHSCPACGFETDRDANAAINVLKRGFSELGLGWPEDTPVETVTATDTDDFREVSASHVVETGSLGVKPRGDSPSGGQYNLVMATKANRDDARRRDIRLIQNPDGRWTARDLDHELSAQGATRNAALDALDDVVEAVHGDGGHEPTDDEIQELGVDPEVARSQREDLPDVLE